MSVDVRHNEELGTYELGADIEGARIVFATIPATDVEARIAAVATEGGGGGTTAGQGGGAGDGGSGGSFDAADFTDNGDGSFTRTSDGTRGRFTPSGFEPIAAP